MQPFVGRGDGPVIVGLDGDCLRGARGAVEGQEFGIRLDVGIDGILLHTVAFLEDDDSRTIRIVVYVGDRQTGRGRGTGSRGAAAASPEGGAAHADLQMLVVAAELDDLPDLGVRRTVGIRRHMVLHLIARFGRDLRRAGHLPFVAVQVFQEPVFHAPGGGAHLEGDLHLGAGQDGAAAVEEPVVVHPRTGDAGVARLDIQFVVAGCVGVLQVIGHILDVTDALDRVDARGILREGAAGIVQVLADGPPQRVRDQGLVLAFVLDGSGHQIARSPVDAHGVARQHHLVQVHGCETQVIDRVHHHD